MVNIYCSDSANPEKKLLSKMKIFPAHYICLISLVFFSPIDIGFAFTVAITLSGKQIALYQKVGKLHSVLTSITD